MATRYPDSRNRRSIEDGDAFEVFVVNALSSQGITLTRAIGRERQFIYGDTLEGVEIKLDARSKDTRRLSIEIAEKTALHRPWVPSGIYATTTATRYAHGCSDMFWIFPTAVLRHYYEHTRPPTIDDNPPTIRRFYLPLHDADHLAESRWRHGKQVIRSGYTSEECDVWLYAHGWKRNDENRWVSPDGHVF